MSMVLQIAPGVPVDKRSYPLVLIILGVLFGLCTLWFVKELLQNPSQALWGFLVSNYIYFLGLTQFGIAFVAILRICGAGWSRPYYRVAELTTLAFFPFAIIGFLFIFYYGSEHLFYWMSEETRGEHLSPWLDSTFLLYRNLLAQLIFYLIAITYFLGGLLPDITTENARQGPVWRQWLYQWLLAIKQKRDEISLKRNVYLYSPIVILAAALSMTFTALDFGMILVPHYHSSVYPMYYIMGNMFAGTAAILILTVIMRRIIALDHFFKTVQVQSIAIMLTAFALFWLYLFWAQFFVSWFGNLPHEYGVLSLQMYGHYAPLFWGMMLCNVGIPIACFIFVKVKQTWSAMILVAIIINIGIWMNRYLLVLPGLVKDHEMFTSFTEISITLGLLAGFLFVLLLSFNMFPMVSMWELRAVEDE